MSDTSSQVFVEQNRSNWVRLRTLVFLRWVAIAGQVSAIAVATFILDLQFMVFAASLVVLSSVLLNLYFSFLYSENRRLYEREATLMLLFDIVQLGLLLYLTGGLTNPFALLMLAPVTIAATFLGLRSMIWVGAISIGLISTLGLLNMPLQTGAGEILTMPALFQFGFWVALVNGILFLSFYARQITTEMQAMNNALAATQMALAREQKLTDLGGVVAAAAHELGTPLATIKLVSGELSEELKDQQDLWEDVALIRQEADRCREILQSMGRSGKEDLHLLSAPFETVVKEAAEPHVDRGITVLISANGDEMTEQPSIPRRPEIIHGLRNLIQNAVDFSNQQVLVKVYWTQDHCGVSIIDDGRGFPASVLGRIGEPFVRKGRSVTASKQREEYQGMGLGLFIAKTLLERSGAEIDFKNDRSPQESLGGAIVEVKWPRHHLEKQVPNRNEGLGNNKLLLS